MFLIGGTPCCERYTIALKNESVNEIVNWLANKCVPRVFATEKFIAINFHTTSGSGAIGGVRFVEPFERPAGRVKLIRVRLAHRINSRLGRGHVRITPQIMFRHWKMPDQR